MSIEHQLTLFGSTPATLATLFRTLDVESFQRRASQFIDTNWLFLQVNDFEAQDSSSWIFLKKLMFSLGNWGRYESADTSDGDKTYEQPNSYHLYLRWLLPFLAPGLRSQNAESSLCSIVLESNGRNSIHVPISLQILLSVEFASHTELHRDPIFAQDLWHPDGRCNCRNTRLIIGDTMDLHQLDSSVWVSVDRDQETPLSLAMRSSAASHLWWKALKDSGVNLREYIARASEEPQLKEKGWTELSLLALFEYCDSYCFRSTSAHGRCDCCGWIPLDYKVEMRWQRRLEQIKSHGQNADQHGLVEAVSEDVSDGEYDEDLRQYEVDEENENKDGTWPRPFAFRNYEGGTVESVCWDCWTNEKCRNGHCPVLAAKMAATPQSTSANSDHDGDSSDCENSPFLPPLPFS